MLFRSGVSRKGFDGRGNYTLGVREQLIFPEILPEKVKTVFGLQVNITTDAGNREKGMALFRLLGFPLENKE